MSPINFSKRNLFRGQITDKPSITPPPWTNEKFTESCTRCDECIKQCEEHILVRGDGGFPSIDFNKGECTFCMACAISCDQNLFDTKKTPAWTLKATINDQCLAQNAIMCRTCEDQCDQHAIQFNLHTGGRATPIILIEDCNGCGACFAPCPTQSIQINEAA